MRSRYLPCLILLPALAAGCVGEIDGPPRGPVGPLSPSDPFVCRPDARPGPSDLRRLTAVEYRNALGDLFAATGVDAPALARDELARLPVDGLEEHVYAAMDNRLGPDHVRAYYDVADRVARSVAEDAARRRAVLGTCGDDPSLTAACIDAFADGFALRAHRRPLTPDERAVLHALSDGVRTGPEVVHALLFVTLLSPAFLYHLELEGAALGEESYFELDPWLLAARLSFHFWRSMPDQELFDAAADGSLATEDGYRAEVDRVFEDPRTRDAIATFYREWLDYDVVGGFPETPVFEAFAAGEDVSVDAMRDEIDLLTRHFTWDAPGTMRDLLLTDLSLTGSAELAHLYGVAPWDGSGAPPSLPPGERPGLFTRAAFLINGEHETSPIHRSAVILRRILCRTIAPPDPTELPEGALDPPVFSPDMTTRQRWEEKTRNPPCNGCHDTINPPGFILERYDALGRIRSTETILDERTGEPVAMHPIDTRATVSFAAGMEREVAEPAELMELVAGSDEVEACFARQYFRFTYARSESAADGCALAGVWQSLGAGDDGPPGSLRDALRAIALDPSFRRRAVGEE